MCCRWVWMKTNFERSKPIFSVLFPFCFTLIAPTLLSTSVNCLPGRVRLNHVGAIGCRPLEDDERPERYPVECVYWLSVMQSDTETTTQTSSVRVPTKHPSPCDKIPLLMVTWFNGIAFRGKPISVLHSVTCHMGSHSVTCHPTPVQPDWSIRDSSTLEECGRLSWPWRWV